MADRLNCNRSRNCHCCGTQRARVQIRVGTPSDPDYAVAFCPTCDNTDGEATS